MVYHRHLERGDGERVNLLQNIQLLFVLAQLELSAD
jgi:hypothetical protein